MAQNEKTGSACASREEDSGCCNVESVVSIDERGQMVLPKEVRDKANICPGDKLVVISIKKNGEFCCLSLIKAQDFEELVKNWISPLKAGMGGKKSEAAEA